MKIHSLAPPGPVPQVQPKISGLGGGADPLPKRGRALASKSGNEDTVELSPEARAKIPTTDLSASEVAEAVEQSGAAVEEESEGGFQLTDEEQQVVRELEARDSEVRAHEAAHQSVAGSLGGSASFTYTTGPDGRQYAVGGEVPIDMSPGGTPQETIARAQTIRAAALAPADPSGQDYAVAAKASQMESEARVEAAREAANGISGAGESEGVEGEAGSGVEGGPKKASAEAPQRLESGLPVSSSHEHMKSDCGFCVRAVSAYGS